tara:strand:- start:1886 stop:3364 length:1479 start_codon:yes stop_codon:yes gene_type:complete
MKKTIKKILIIIIFILLSAFSVRYWYTIQSQALWNSTKDTLSQDGLSFDIQDVIPIKVPDETNFALSEIFKSPDQEFLKIPKFNKGFPSLNFSYETSDNFIDLKNFQEYFRNTGLDLWRQPAEKGEPAEDVLMAIETLNSDLKLLEKTIQERPDYNCNLNFKTDGLLIEAWSQQPESQMIHMNAQWWLLLRSHAFLEREEPSKALKDLEHALFLAECFKDDPRLTTQVLRSRMLTALMSPIWQGLAKMQWKAEHIQSIHDLILNIDLLSGFAKAIDFERHNLNHIHEQFRSLIKEEKGEYRASLISVGLPKNLLKPFKYFYISPGAFIDRSQTRANRLYRQYLFEGIDLENKRVRLDKISELVEQVEDNKEDPLNLLSALTMPLSSNLPESIGTTQVMVHHALIACKIELYKIERGVYPLNLEELQKKLPTDVFSGQSYKYAIDKMSRYRISSEGSNPINGEQKPTESKQSSNKTKQKNRDLIWHYLTSQSK